MHRKNLFWGALLLTLTISAAGAGLGWACSSMGPDKHVGVVQAINTPEGALVLVDAETGKPIRFIASAKVLEGVKVHDKAVVTFKTEGDRLLAKEIVIAKG
ncbi:MAG: hypothetical protein EPO39_16165 [Candidatus Manganitrophaceae bacterium]|nr:MAG: hypothetical protein EPO39_16165 [Candidatus Manganitrophaceae bacterium]